MFEHILRKETYAKDNVDEDAEEDVDEDAVGPKREPESLAKVDDAGQ